MAYVIQVRRDLAAQWTSVNPTLANGEWGYEHDTDKIKMGNGLLVWNLLPYFSGVTSEDSIRILLTADGYYDIPQFYLLTNFVVQPVADINLKVGSTAGGEEYFFETPVTAADGAVYEINKFAIVTKRVYFYGITADTAIVLFIKYIKQS